MNPPPHPEPGLPRHRQHHHHQVHLQLDPRHHHHVNIHLCCRHHHHHHHGAHPLAPAPPHDHNHNHHHQHPAPVLFPQGYPCAAAPWQPEPSRAAVGDDVGDLDPEQGRLYAEEAGEDEEEPVFVLTDEWAEFFAKSEAKMRLAKQQKKTKGRK